MPVKHLLNTFQDARVNLLWALSDTVLLEQVAKRYPDIMLPEEWAAIQENQEMCFGGLDHYAASPNHNYEFTEEKTKFEWLALTSSLRWRAVKDVLRPEILPPTRVLDFGTHTGAHAVDMSNWWPDASVYGREIVRDIIPAIEYTVAQYAQHPAQLRFDIGDHRTPSLPQHLDLLYAGEVFEHLWEWREFITTLENACREGGQIILTTPIGPWEMNNDRHIHVGHWEVEDLHEVFGSRPGFKTLELINRNCNSLPMGWIITTWFAEPGKPFGEVNFNRKLTRWGFPG